MKCRSLRGCLFLGPSLHSPRPCQRTVWRGSFAPLGSASSLRPQNFLRLLGAKRGTRRRRHEAEQARTAGRGRRRRDGCEAHEGCIQPHADRAVSGEAITAPPFDIVTVQ